MTSMAIIAINLCKLRVSCLSVLDPQRKGIPVDITDKGCKLLMLVSDAIAPVMNGNTALPAEPKLAIQLTEPEMSSGGRVRPAWFIAMGKIGPRKKPTKETATSSRTSRGTCQTTSSSLRV